MNVHGNGVLLLLLLFPFFSRAENENRKNGRAKRGEGETRKEKESLNSCGGEGEEGARARICKFNNANLAWVRSVVQDSLHVLAVHYACVLCAPVAPNQGSPLLRKPNAA